jgi:hypothetical protein
VRKLVLLVGGSAAAVTMAVVGAGQASAQAPDVVGETYGKAVAILKSQGYNAIFGGSVGSDLPQSQCLVIEQQAGKTQWGQTGGTVRLRLDCTLQPGQTQPQAPNTHSLVPPGGSIQTGTSGAPAPADPNRPTPGAGTVTVTPRQLG